MSSPVFSPGHSLFTTSSVQSSDSSPKSLWLFPWLAKESTPSPSPEYWNPLVCNGAGPNCLAKLESLGLIAQGTQGSSTELSAFSNPTAVRGGALTAGELGRNIVAQIEVECPKCGYGTDRATKKSSKSTVARIDGLPRLLTVVLLHRVGDVRGVG